MMRLDATGWIVLGLGSILFLSETVAEEPAREQAISWSVKCRKEAYKAGEPLTFGVTIKNTSKQGFMLYNTDHYHGWKFILSRTGTDEMWHAACVARIRYKPNMIVLNPGGIREVKVVLGRFFQFILEGQKGPSRKLLPTGTYKLVIEREFREHPQAHAMDTIHDFWKGKVKSAPVEISIRK
ncbi:MAG: hypothetical protein QGG53_20585 [Planctomycetota bacterium]|jgi:hypothetical protein|nr:hypothetical protein [Planctomycetota bacterium]